MMLRKGFRAIPATAGMALLAGGLLVPVGAARAEVEAVTLRLEEARCFS